MSNCMYCYNRYVDKNLNEENDIGFYTIGSCETKYTIFFESGWITPTGITFWKMDDNTKQNKIIGKYIPRYCPECGRKLKENEKFRNF